MIISPVNSEKPEEMTETPKPHEEDKMGRKESTLPTHTPRQRELIREILDQILYLILSHRIDESIENNKRQNRIFHTYRIKEEQE